LPSYCFPKEILIKVAYFFKYLSAFSTSGLTFDDADATTILCWYYWLKKVKIVPSDEATGQNGVYTDSHETWRVRKKVKLSLQQAVEARRIVRRRGSHIF
jgi:hypothetical protein